MIRWVWARRSTRWDVHPQAEPSELIRVERSGAFVRLFSATGCALRVPYVIEREATADEILKVVVAS